MEFESITLMAQPAPWQVTRWNLSTRGMSAAMVTSSASPTSGSSPKAAVAPAADGHPLRDHVARVVAADGHEVDEALLIHLGGEESGGWAFALSLAPPPARRV